MRQWLLAVLMAFSLTGCSTVTLMTDIDQDPDFTFANVEDYVFLDQKQNSLTDTHITKAIKQNLAAKGYRETMRGDADTYILFHLDVQSTTKVQTDYEYVGIRPYPYNHYKPHSKTDLPRPHIDPYYYDRSLRSTTQTYEYKEGKLIVDFYDPKTNRVVWRGIAKDELQDHNTPQKKIKYINTVIDELLKTFPARPGFEQK